MEVPSILTSGVLVSDSYLPHTPLSRCIDNFISIIGRGLVFIWLILLAVIVVNVISRYVFSQGHIELEELQWHLYSIGFIFGISYAYQSDAHIRVDMLYENFSDPIKAWIELYGTLLFLVPFIILILVFSIQFVSSSWAVGEVSSAPGGLPFRYLIKAALPTGFLLLLLAVVSRLTRIFQFLFFSSAKGSSNAGK